MKYRFAKSLFIANLTFCLAFCLMFQAYGQTNDEKEVRILSEAHSKNWECLRVKNAVISKEDFRRLRADKECSNLTETLAVDFEKQTLIAYNVKGDCFVSGSAKVFRSDAQKKYVIRIRTKSGGCRAAGSFLSLIVIEKIPADYKVEFNETNVEKTYKQWNEKDVTHFITSPQPLETKEINLKGCIQTIFTRQFVIRDEAAYLKTIRSDASRDYCLKNLEKIDFSKHTLLGIDIDSGYCGVPVGLEYQVIKDAVKKQYIADISYLDSEGRICRALSQYDLWLLVPKLPDDYEVKFEVKARQITEK